MFHKHNLEEGYLSVIVLILVMLSVMLVIPISLRTSLVSNLVHDEKEFVFLDYQCGRGLLWSLGKAKQTKLDNWPNTTIRLNGEKGSQIIITLIKRYSGYWEIGSEAISADNKYSVKKIINIRCLKEVDGNNKYEIRDIKRL